MTKISMFAANLPRFAPTHNLARPGSAFRTFWAAVAVLSLCVGPGTSEAAAASTLTATQLASNAETCRTGLQSIQANLYRYPDKPDVAPSGKESWNDAYDAFKSANLPSCQNIQNYLQDNPTTGITQGVTLMMTADGISSFGEYFDGRTGIVFQGNRIPQYCPGLNRIQFNCVEASQRIEEHSTQVIEILDRLAALECEPATGWSGCRTVATGSGDLFIYGSAASTAKAQTAVDTVYTTMLSDLQPAYPKSKFAGYKVYLTNGEPWSELEDLPPMGFMGSPERNDELRGGTTPSFLWISEQMICKKGVATRNAAFAANQRTSRDDGDRTFDQVVHEFAHAIDFKFDLGPLYSTSIFPGSPPNFPPAEAWAWGVQSYFGTPAGTLNEKQRTFLEKIFKNPGSDPFQCSALIGD